MKETQLHYIWERSLLPKTRLRTAQGELLYIISKGVYNENEGGPDFLNAHIRVGELEWFGNIEIHIKTSDWIRHGHHQDRNYDSVILHVVFEHDVCNDNKLSSLPTLVVSEIYDAETIRNVARGAVINKHILCKDQLSYLTKLQLTFIKDEIIYERLVNRTAFTDQFFSAPREVLYYLIAQAFGRKVNSNSFNELIEDFPIKDLLVRDEDDKMIIIQKKLQNIQSGNKAPEFTLEWRHKGLRPRGFPAVRLMQFSAFFANYDFNYQFIHFRAKEIYTYLLEMFEARNLFLNRHGIYVLSSQMKIGLIVNAFVPFMFWYGQNKNDHDVIERSMELLRLTGVEDNYVTRIWNKTSVKLENALDSQAHLGIYNQFCRGKKCVRCPIGKLLLGH